MPTRLGNVTITIKLDVSEARQQLRQFERRRASPVDGDGRDGDGRLWQPSQLRRDLFRRAAEREVRTAYASKLLHAAGRQLPTTRIGGMGQAMLAGIDRIVPDSVSPAIKGAAGALAKGAAIYAIASGTAKILPEAVAFGKQIGGEPGGPLSTHPVIRGIEESVDSLRRAFVTLEVSIMSVIPAFQKQVDVARASLRLTGEMPNTEYYRKMFLTEERQTMLMADKFKVWKAKEAPFVVTRTLGDTFKRQLTR